MYKYFLNIHILDINSALAFRLCIWVVLPTVWRPFPHDTFETQTYIYKGNSSALQTSDLKVYF
jgi:hypothetical protein